MSSIIEARRFAELAKQVLTDFGADRATDTMYTFQSQTVAGKLFLRPHEIIIIQSASGLDTSHVLTPWQVEETDQ